MLQRTPQTDRRPRAAHIWTKDRLGFYIEPAWVPERLFAVEIFEGVVWDPAAGIGRIPDAAQRAGYRTIATDIVDRGCPNFYGLVDFLQSDCRVDNIVCNPPYQDCRAFARQALKLATKKIAMILLGRRLNAARWLRETPLARVYLLTPRPSMPPGHVILAGKKPGGGTQDFVWLIFEHGHAGPPELRWLHRDGGPASHYIPVANEGDKSPQFASTTRRLSTPPQQGRQIRAADRVLMHMAAGATLQLMHSPTGPCWTLSDGRHVPTGVAELVVRSASVTAMKDGLFKDASQTWRWWKE